MTACRATLDTPAITELVTKLVEARPANGARLQLARVLDKIDEVNANDPGKVEYDGKRHPYRLLYSQWVSEWVQKLDPGAPDELFILARGQNVEGWRLSEIKRDDYAPNSQGQKQCEADRKKWLADRLTGIMKEAGYGPASCSLCEDFVIGRNLPDPQDVRLYDLQGPMGQTNYRLLELVKMVQTLRDAEGLVFMQHSFGRMFDALPADEVLPEVKRTLVGCSKQAIATVLQMEWTPLQRKLIRKALPTPPGWGDTLRELEGTAAASNHPGDWRYVNFDYE